MKQQKLATTIHMRGRPRKVSRSAESGMPECFTRRAWDAWRDALRRTDCRRPPADVYCEDCTPEYKAWMLRAGRCAHPGTVFVIAEGEGILGLRNPSDDLVTRARDEGRIVACVEEMA